MNCLNNPGLDGCAPVTKIRRAEMIVFEIRSRARSKLCSSPPLGECVDALSAAVFQLRVDGDCPAKDSSGATIERTSPFEHASLVCSVGHGC